MAASRTAAVTLRILVGYGVSILAGSAFGQQYSGQSAPNLYPPYPQPPAQQYSSVIPQDELDNLVAPITLYPDPLLSQVLAASTYPLEIVEARQWLQQHPDLRGPELIDAARQTGWDPSVQALVAFPDVLAMLNRDVQWTTNLGNAFLAQQSDVLAAIQRMRATAEQNGQLRNTPQQVVTNDQQFDPQYGQGAIQIQPANPQVMYIPTYNPEAVWGPPPVGAYPALGYPPYGYGIGFGVATLIGSLFTGFLSFGGWGWGLSWLTHSLLLNGLFFSHFGFGGGGFGGVWAHNPAHRLGVPYSSQLVSSRFGGSYNTRSAGFTGYRAGAFGTRGGSPEYGGYNSGNYGGSGYGGSGYRGSTGFRGESRGYSAPGQSYSRSFASPSRPYGYSAPSQGYSTPRSLSPEYSARSYAPSRAYGGNFSQRAFSGGGGEHFSAPKSTGHFSAPHFSGGGHSSGHSSGGHFGGGHHRH